MNSIKFKKWRNERDTLQLKKNTQNFKKAKKQREKARKNYDKKSKKKRTPLAEINNLNQLSKKKNRFKIDKKLKRD